jgi:hypothetical protein
MAEFSLTQIGHDIIEKNIGLVGAFVRRYKCPGYYDPDDYMSEMTSAFCQCVGLWARNGCQLSTWAFRAMWNARTCLNQKITGRAPWH